MKNDLFRRAQPRVTRLERAQKEEIYRSPTLRTSLISRRENAALQCWRM